MATVVAVIHRAGLVPAEGRILQSCRGSRGWQHSAGQLEDPPAQGKLLSGRAWVLFPKSLLLVSHSEPQTILLPFPDITLLGSPFPLPNRSLPTYAERKEFIRPSASGKEPEAGGRRACFLHIHPLFYVYKTVVLPTLASAQKAQWSLDFIWEF